VTINPDEERRAFKTAIHAELPDDTKFPQQQF
jgi:hypothetical protein